jgi:hypothetical protein
MTPQFFSVWCCGGPPRGGGRSCQKIRPTEVPGGVAKLSTAALPFCSSALASSYLGLVVSLLGLSNIHAQVHFTRFPSVCSSLDVARRPGTA